jgi:hypothetical protein
MPATIALGEVVIGFMLGIAVAGIVSTVYRMFIALEPPVANRLSKGELRMLAAYHKRMRRLAQKGRKTMARNRAAELKAQRAQAFKARQRQLFTEFTDENTTALEDPAPSHNLPRN